MTSATLGHYFCLNNKTTKGGHTMKTLKATLIAIFLGIFFIACNNTERQLEQAYQHTCKQEWIEAAESLNKIEPAKMAKIMINGDDIALRNFEKSTSAIMESGDIEAIKIYTRWIEDVNRELGKQISDKKLSYTP